MRTAVRTATLSALVALLLAAAWLFLPTALGGSTTYVSTYGTSMEPGFSTGDLAVLRPADGYEVGDVVAYRSDGLATTVMHRIVERDGDRFVTQGDNNSFLDEDHPTADEVMGSLWFRIPQGGKALAALRSPAVLGVVSLAIGAAHVGRPPPPPSRARPRTPPAQRSLRCPPSPPPRGPAPAARPSPRAPSASSASPPPASLLVLPEEQTSTRAVPVTQSGRFTYSGEAFPGTTYPDGRDRHRRPDLHRARRRADRLLRADAGLGRRPAHRRHGPARPLAHRPRRLDRPSSTAASAVPLQDSAATATVDLDTVGAAALLAAHYYEVGVDGGTATLTVTPEVDVDGTVDGRPFAAHPADRAGLHPRPRRAQDGRRPRGAGDLRRHHRHRRGARAPHVRARPGAALARRRPGARPRHRRPRPAGLGRRRPGSAVRAQASAVDLFLQRRAGRVLAVAGFVPDGTVVEVADPEALYKVAERLDGLVLHHAGPDGDTFAVRDVGTTYRCVVPRAVAPDAEAPPGAHRPDAPPLRLKPLPRPQLSGKLPL